MKLYLLKFESGKCYIGQTVRMLEVRLAQHRQAALAGSQLPVHCAWRKYGEPSVDVLGEYEDTDALSAAEIDAIRRYSTLSPGGYNVSFGGDTAPSKNPDVAAKISAKAKGRVHSEVTRNRMAVVSAERWLDPDYRAKVDAAVRASWTPEMRAAASERGKARKGAKRSEETKAKLRGRVFSEETRARMSAAAKLRVRGPRSDETKAKIAANTKAAWADPEVTAKRVAALRTARNDPAKAEHRSATAAASWQDPEIRARRSAAIREGHRRRKDALAKAQGA